jgi:2-dehydropantoate 2-reductase
MGSLVGGQLRKAGADVTLIDIWKEHVAAINRNGLTMLSDQKQDNVKIRAVTSPPPGERFDIVVILVKSARTREAAETAKTLLNDNGVAVSFQNGVGNEDIIAEVLGIDRTLGATLYFAGAIVEPGTVKQTTSKMTAAVGALSPAGHSMAKALAETINRSDIQCRLEDDVLALKWEKMLINIGANAMAVISNNPNRTAGDDKNMRAAMIAICAEAIKVAKAKGIRLIGGEDAAAYVRKATDVHSYEQRSSMTLDLAAGRKTEVDVTNGAIERFGDELGIDTPLNTIVVQAILRVEKEKGADRPG